MIQLTASGIPFVVLDMNVSAGDTWFHNPVQALASTGQATSPRTPWAYTLLFAIRSLPERKIKNPSIGVSTKAAFVRTFSLTRRSSRFADAP
jgi:hypothetical protein